MTVECLVTPSTTLECRGPSPGGRRGKLGTPVTPVTLATPFDYNDDDENAKKRRLREGVETGEGRLVCLLVHMKEGASNSD